MKYRLSWFMSSNPDVVGDTAEEIVKKLEIRYPWKVSLNYPGSSGRLWTEVYRESSEGEKIYIGIVVPKK